jgi:LAO/AO transport system kinase
MHDLTPRLQDLLERFRAGQRVALARGISLVENERPGFQAFLHHVLASGIQAARVGVTGPPGAGKSTLVAALATGWRAEDEEVGVVAVDPTSPFSGGALLGDRIRMNDLATDPGIFIRSMATRGSLGGLAATTREVLDLMDGFGFPRLLVETVGVGQTELEITGAADTVVVVLVPESGDGIQAMKAGLMEIADIFVVNKADRPGADRLLKEIRAAIHLRGPAGGPVDAGAGHHGVDLSRVGSDAPSKEPRRWEPPEGWTIPVIKTVAHAGEGLDELRAAIAAHRTHLLESGELEARRRARTETRIRDVVERELRRRAWADAQARERLAAGPDRVVGGDDTPYSVAAEIVDGLLRREAGA